VGGRSGKIRSSAIVRGVAGGEDGGSIRENARMRCPRIVLADHEKTTSLIEMVEEGARRFAHVFVPLG
jgi:hypothetical protein